MTRVVVQASQLLGRISMNGYYFQLITTPGLEPTNSRAEQAIRFVVLDRLMMQGTHSERSWTAMATCRQQQRSVFEFLYQTVSNHFAGRPTPSLLPAGP